MSIYSAFHIRDARSLSLLKYLPSKASFAASIKMRQMLLSLLSLLLLLLLLLFLLLATFPFSVQVLPIPNRFIVSDGAKSTSSKDILEDGFASSLFLLFVFFVFVSLLLLLFLLFVCE